MFGFAMIKMIILALLSLSLIGWLIYFFLMLWNYSKIPILSDKSINSLKQYPLVSIVIPARNESERIGKCIRSLKNQDYPNFEVIIIDDSFDNTKAIIKKIIKDDQRFKIIKQKKLEKGWVGKPFALQQGSKIAKGSWLLFIDADTEYDKKIIKSSIKHVIENDLDMLSLAPRHKCKTFWENIIQPIPLGFLPALSPIGKVNDSKSKVALAIGPFIMIKKNVFEKIGGYKPIKNKIGDDVEIAKLLKSSGYKIGIANAKKMMNLRMYQNPSQIWKGWSKNIFMGLVQKRKIKSKLAQTSILIAGLFLFFTLLLLPFVTFLLTSIFYLISGDLLFYMILLSMTTFLLSILSICTVQYLYKIGNPIYSPFVIILGGISIMGIFLNSGVKTISGKGVTWKGRKYT